MKITAPGIALIVIAFALGGIQDLNFYNIYVSSSYKWYFYASITVLLILGIVLVAYGMLKNKPKKNPEQTAHKN